MVLSSEYLGGAVAPEGMVDFHFVRHGKTELNTDFVVEGGVKKWFAQGGGTDIGLNDVGKIQARMAGNVLRTLSPSQVFCSPKLRAIQTAVFANVACVGFHIDEDLDECHFGSLEGKLAPLELFEGNFGDGERKPDFSRRVAKALERTRSENTLLVAHGGVLRVIAALLGVELPREHLENGRVIHFQKLDSIWTVKLRQSPVILVSGANRGIGRAIAEELIAHGYRLSLGARDVGALEAAFGPQSEQLHYARFDAEDPDTMEAWVKAAIETFGRIDGLVNNAGLGAKITDNLMNGTRDELNRVMAVNCQAPWLLTQLCLPYLKKTGAGRIVNINSLSGLRVNKSTNFIYNASKHAQTALTDTTRYDSWESGVRVTAISPGWVATDMSRHSKINSEDMTQPKEIARITRSAIEMPNNASIARLAVNCEYEPLF
ncbi:SDR family NAD(P)-dependent oxidoreductase [Mesorhizobium sp. GbtcB19]|uniref:SDR family NAD(P)-dependent oxidoreductase n=1 Tax=Mesorhizobium sp. GbtcB19 TaxID=2824764 RepID=UPI001C307962|nr:SDR family NAD(P)-dependent oxidoreductase [Mesorhizobium sp. GbtcB19]